jgi:DNA-binding SARP family transcriptional activator
MEKEHKYLDSIKQQLEALLLMCQHFSAMSMVIWRLVKRENVNRGAVNYTSKVTQRNNYKSYIRAPTSYENMTTFI